MTITQLANLITQKQTELTKKKGTIGRKYLLNSSLLHNLGLRCNVSEE